MPPSGTRIFVTIEFRLALGTQCSARGPRSGSVHRPSPRLVFDRQLWTRHAPRSLIDKISPRSFGEQETSIEVGNGSDVRPANSASANARPAIVTHRPVLCRVRDESWRASLLDRVARLVLEILDLVAGLLLEVLGFFLDLRPRSLALSPTFCSISLILSPALSTASPTSGATSFILSPSLVAPS